MIYGFGEFRLDTDRQEFWRGEDAISLEPQVFRLLRHLIEHRARVVSKEELIDHVWDGRIVSDATLSSRINAARRATGDSGRDQAVIRTLVRRGFRFIAEVHEAGAVPGHKAQAQDSASGDGHSVPATETESRPTITRASKELPAKPSIAVLPFTNMSGDPDQEYFADGITEEITTALARYRWLHVAAHSSSFFYKGKMIDVRRVASDLGVKYVLEGSIRRSGQKVRVIAQLIDGTLGMHVWTERYERDLQDVFVLQDEIANVIAGTIEPELGLIEAVALRGRRQVDLDAWDSHQRGLAHLHRFTEDELECAKVLFSRAIDLDADFALAHARLAQTYLQLVFYGPRSDKRNNLGAATKHAHRAVYLDDREAMARLVLGRSLALACKFERGIEELRAAVQLNPSLAHAHYALGQALNHTMRPAEALSSALRAIELSSRDPQLWAFLQVKAVAHYLMGDYALAERGFRNAIFRSNSTHWPVLWLLATLAKQGKTEGAPEEVARLQSMRPRFVCEDIRSEFLFDERPVYPEDFIAEFVGLVRSAGLP